MASYSFDIVSDYDKAELNNVFEQTKREIASRYDFKNTPAEIDWLNPDKTGFKLVGSGEYQIDAITDIIRKKLAARDQSQKLLDVSSKPIESNMKVTKDITFKRGLSGDQAKQIVRLINDNFKKVKATIQGDLIRVTSGTKDDLQAVINLVRSKDYDFPLQFVNYR